MTTLKVDRFHGRFFFLSNFFPVEVGLDDETYPSVEHAYQAAKTRDPYKRARIRVAATPHLAKKMGRGLTLRASWNDQRVEVMRGLLVEKFAYEDLAQLLVDTGKAHIEEGNTWGDAFWGVFYPTAGEPFGDNRLGQLLMDMRAQILSVRLAGEATVLPVGSSGGEKK
jgi:ribA/ribD-fused uncharacterized protein